jgi:hypothetical protein
LILGGFLLFFLDRLLSSGFFSQDVGFLLLVIVSTAHPHAGRFFCSVFFFLFLHQMLVDVFFGDLEFGFEQLNVLIDNKQDVFLLDFKFFVDLSQTRVYLFEIANR